MGKTIQRAIDLLDKVIDLAGKEIDAENIAETCSCVQISKELTELIEKLNSQGL